MQLPFPDLGLKIVFFYNNQRAWRYAAHRHASGITLLKETSSVSFYSPGNIAWTMADQHIELFKLLWLLCDTQVHSRKWVVVELIH